MKTDGRGIFLILIVHALSMAASQAAAQTQEQGPWWPHPIWGAGDEAGASNWITPQKVLEALRLVSNGVVYDLGHVYESGMPVAMSRPYSLEHIGPLGPFGENAIVMNSELLCTEIGQVGTQFDGLGHVGTRMTMADGSEKDVYYNGFTGDEIVGPGGLKQLGIEKVRPVITRGILIDMAQFKGQETLSRPYEVTLDDMRGALAAQGFEGDAIRDGDAILIRFGSKWDPSQYGPGAGIGLEVAQWLASEKISLLGSDRVGEVSPNPDPDLVFPLHQELMQKNGIFNLESMNLEQLAASRIYEFAFVFNPLPIKGATGSPGRPLAIQ
jgi:hypothetical protein